MKGMSDTLRTNASRALRRLRRLMGAPRLKVAPLEGQFQPYSHTLPNRYPWLFKYAQSQLAEVHAPRLLSFGCSRGDEVFALREYFPDSPIKGIEVVPKNVEICARRARDGGLQGVEFALAADTKAEASGSFDAIFCLAVLCNGDLTTYRAGRSDPLLSFERFSQVIEDFERCLAPQGWLFLLTTNFRLSDTPSARAFDPLLKARPEQLAPDVLFDKNNRLLPGETYPWVAFRKRTPAIAVSSP